MSVEPNPFSTPVTLVQDGCNGIIDRLARSLSVFAFRVRMPQGGRDRAHRSPARRRCLGHPGILASRVATAQDAARMAQACRFPPRGIRSQSSALPLFGDRKVPARQITTLCGESTFVVVAVEMQFEITQACLAALSTSYPA